MSDGVFLLALGSLCLAAGAILLTIGLWQQGYRRMQERQSWRHEATAPEPCSSWGPLCGRWRCSPGCRHCIQAARELQQLVLTARAGTGASATLDADTWRAAWQDLEELLEHGQLCCHGCSCPSSSESLRERCPRPDGGAPVERRPTPFPALVGRVSAALKMHVARKGLEMQLGALPVPVQLSQQRAAQQQGRRVLPKLLRPGQRQPLPRRGLCPSLQVKANAIVDTIREKEERRLWGDPNPTEESLALLVPCPPPLLAPLDPQVPQEQGAHAPRAPGQASAVGQPAEGQQEPRSRQSSEEEPAVQPPEGKPAIQPAPLGKVPSDSLLRLDGGLSPWDEECLWPFGLAMASLALPRAGNGAAAPEAGTAAGSAAILPEEDVAHQHSLTSRGGGQDDAEDRIRPRAAAPDAISRLELSQEVRSALWMHAAKKCLEMKLQRFPAAVQQSLEMLHPPLPKAGRPGPGPLGPRSASAPFLKHQPDRDMLQRLRASLTCPKASTTLRSCSQTVSMPGPVPEEESSQASLEASTLPSASCGSGVEMGTAATAAVLRTPRGTEKGSAGQASALVSPGLFPGLPATDSRSEPCQRAKSWVPCGGFVAPAPEAPNRHCGCCTAQASSAAGGFQHLSAAVPAEGTRSTEKTRSTEGSPRSTDLGGRWNPVSFPPRTPPRMALPPPTSTPSSPEETPSQDSTSCQHRCRAPATRHVCSCRTCPARDAQDTATLPNANTLRSVLEKIIQR